MAARSAAWICLAIGGLTLVGWAFDVPRLKDFFGVGITMKANAALAMALAGAAVWLLLPGDSSFLRRASGYLVAGMMMAIGGLTLSQHIFGWNLGIDELLAIEQPGEAATMSPGRMGPPASTCYLLGGLALLMIHRSRRPQLLAHWLAIGVGLVSMLGILGSLYQAEQLYAVARYTGIAAHTACGLFAFSVGLLCLRSDRGIMAVFTSSESGGVLMRRLLLPLIALTVVMAAMRLLGEEAGWFDRGFGVSLFVLAMIVILASLVTWTALELNRHSAMRNRAESVLQQQNDHLQMLYRLSAAVSRAATVDQICTLALDELMKALRADRASVLLFDADGIMRFKAWRGLSETYRRAVEGHSPWKPDTRDPQAITVEDVEKSEPLRPLRDTIVGEGIHALAFIPLVDDERLLGKFMLYFDQPHEFTQPELAVARAVAASVAFSINRATSEQATLRLAAIVESSEDAIISKDLNGIIRSWNAGAEQLFGYAAHEAIGQPITMLIPPERHDDEREILDRLRRGERIELFETVRVAKGGRVMDVSVTVSPLRERGGAIIGASTVMRDITARKATELALARSERLYRGIGESINYGIWVCEPDGRNVYASPSFLDLVGITQQQCSEFGWGDVLHPDDSAATIAAWKECSAKGTFWEREHRFRGKDGKWHHVLARGVPIRDDSGQIICWAGINLDISHLKSAQEALADSEKRLRLALRAGRSGVWDWDIAGNRVTWSEYLYELHGLSREQFGGTVEAFSELVHPEDQKYVRERIQAAMEDREPYELEFRTIRSDGAIVWISTSAMVLRDEHGQACRMIGVTSDITARKRAEEELQRHSHNLEDLVAERTVELERTHERLRLSERMAALGTLAAGLGHDMGNLLLPVRVRLQALQGMPLTDDAVEHLGVVNTCISYLQNLAKGLRLFALDPNVIDAADTTNLRDWRAQVESFFRSALPRDVRLEWSFPESLPLLRVARHALTQAVYNLVQNAGDATRNRADGVVRVWAEASSDGQTLRLGVSDNGVGMSPQIKRRCLEPFFTTKTRSLSTGLGLSLMHGIVQRCGGSVDIQTEIDKGTTFVMTLPACAREPEGGPSRCSRPTAVVSIADSRLAAFVTAVLRAQRFDVRTDANGDNVRLWVLAGDEDAMARADAYLAADPSTRVLILGAQGNGHHVPEQVMLVPGSPPLTAVQQAVRGIAAAIAASPASEPSSTESTALVGEEALDPR